MGGSLGLGRGAAGGALGRGAGEADRTPEPRVGAGTLGTGTLGGATLGGAGRGGGVDGLLLLVFGRGGGTREGLPAPWTAAGRGIGAGGGKDFGLATGGGTLGLGG